MVRLTDRPNMTIAVDLEVKNQTKQTNLPLLIPTLSSSCQSQLLLRERSGSVVECLTRDRGAGGSSLNGVTALLSLSKTHLS